ncbi:NitT/TauT family transport system permease protein [Thermosporothrix hazakensis]|jgi:NitT/TauT family transport system permease protein|uniref:NitT/TauT family transport system permease protein n=2 Tax=Thermosporothrix TaxID=768650 RepID=A0A326UCT4_THEHA|nr:ABC transporter permease [Thermosporothrix hazakensis]PZW36126.1 NitT/TauT family transport system permease protein [Thermosporothrix hazakensis]BBH88592.1 sulfate ABC transporter permease [Thermosporothrix sp. COM3]GCE46777.1 sulfate ABC transporter permease [Thermosporothrix hazakensis]
MAKAIKVAAPAERRLSVGTWVRRIVFYIAVVLFWQGIVSLHIWPEYALPGPLEVLNALILGLQSGLFVLASLVSLQRMLIGYAISMVIGVLLGILIGRVRVAEETLGTLVMGLQALPSVCWLPLAVLWFGLSEQAIIFVVVMGALFSITLGVVNGIKNTPPIYLNAARTLGARGIALATQVILPAAMPAILNGFKQGWGFAWRSLMAGELLFASLSLGNQLQAGRDLNDAAKVLAVMLVIIAIGVIIDSLLFATLERRLRERWGLQR